MSSNAHVCPASSMPRFLTSSKTSRRSLRVCDAARIVCAWYGPTRLSRTAADTTAFT
jgi:hypothetical protein